MPGSVNRGASRLHVVSETQTAQGEEREKEMIDAIVNISEEDEKKLVSILHEILDGKCFPMERNEANDRWAANLIDKMDGAIKAAKKESKE